MGLRRTASALVCLLVLGACSTEPATVAAPGPAAPTSSATTPSAPRTIVVEPIPVPPGIHLSFVQQRIDEGTRSAQVRVVNGTDDTLHVDEVGVDWAGYPLHLQEAPYDVYPGQTVDLRYLLPRAVCTPAAAAARPYGVAVTDRGRVRRAMTADGVRFLTRLRETACNARRLDATATITYGDDWRPDTNADGRPVLHGSLVLQRAAAATSGAGLRVVQVEGSVLFDLSLNGDRAARTLRPRAARAAVPITVRDGGRCDPHSRGQSTQTFLFRAFLSLDGGPEISRLVVPSPAQQRLLLRFLDRACAESGQEG